MNIRLLSIFPFLFCIWQTTPPQNKELLTFLTVSQKRFETSRFEKAFEYCEKAYSISRTIKSKSVEQHCTKQLAIISWILGNYAASKSFFQKHIILFPSDSREYDLTNRCLSILEMYNNAKQLRDKAQYDESIHLFNKAIHHSENVDDKKGYFKCRLVRQNSINYFYKNLLNEFLQMNLISNKTARENGLKSEEALSLQNIGTYYEKTHNYYKSLIYLKRALRIMEKHGLSRLTANCLNSISVILMNLSLFDQSQEILIKLLSEAEKRDVPYYRNNLAIISRRRGNYQSALEHLNIALKVTKQNNMHDFLPTVYINMGLVYSDMNQYQKALEHYSVASTLLPKNDEDRNMHLSINIGKAFLGMGKIFDAGNLFSEIIRKAGTSRSYSLWEAYQGLAAYYEKMNNPKFAIDSYCKALEIINDRAEGIQNDLLRAGFSKDKIGLYECICNLISDDYSRRPSKDKLNLIWSMIEKSKARGFFQTIIGSQRAKSLSIPSPVQSMKWKGFNSETADIFNRINSYILPEISTPEPSINMLQAFLDDKTVIFEYFVGEKHSLLLCIGHNQIELHRLPSESTIESEVKGYILAVSRRDNDRTSIRKAAKRISGLLLFPLNNKNWQNAKNMLIIPDAILFRLPFDTLTHPAFDYPIALNQIVTYSQSTDSLLFLSKKARVSRVREPRLFAIGNPAEIPNYDHVLPNWINSYRLPSSHTEIDMISRYFGVGDKKVLAGLEASESSIKSTDLSRYDILHFACHGYTDEVNPFRSALIFGPGPGRREDGLLRTDEISGMDIDADLVVLSACRSAGGLVERGEGVLGLTRSFFYAGARSVVSSLWSVDDESTGILMDRFYRELKTGATAAEALSRAKRWMLESPYSNPYYWGAFILNGDFRSAPFKPGKS